MKFREFLTRGIERVRVEHNLVCTAHNLKIIWAKMAGKVAVLGKIGCLIANQFGIKGMAFRCFSFSSSIN
jgi:hypothetical protein